MSSDNHMNSISEFVKLFVLLVVCVLVFVNAVVEIIMFATQGTITYSDLREVVVHTTLLVVCYLWLEARFKSS